MVKTEKLLLIAKQEKIAIGEFDSKGYCKGVYIRGEELSAIGLDPNLTPTEMRCTLAEELGHHFTLPMGMDLRESNRYKILTKRVLYETKARMYAADLLMPYEQWMKAISKKDVTIEELMTTFDVTAEMVCYKLDNHYFGTVFVNPRKHMGGIPEDHLPEEIRMLNEEIDAIIKEKAYQIA